MRSSLKITMFAIAALTAAKVGALGVDALQAQDLQAEDAAGTASIASGADTPPVSPAEGLAAEGLAPADPFAAELQASPTTPAMDAIAQVGAAGPVLPELLVDIDRERRALAERREQLEIEAADLEIVRATLSRQHDELSALQTELDRLLGNLRTGHADDVERLVRIYEAMKPAEAGAIMSDMDLEVATLVIAAMKESKSGPILAKMDAQRAQIISKIIYERSKMPGDQKPVVVPARG